MSQIHEKYVEDDTGFVNQGGDATNEIPSQEWTDVRGPVRQSKSWRVAIGFVITVFVLLMAIDYSAAYRGDATGGIHGFIGALFSGLTGWARAANRHGANENEIERRCIDLGVKSMEDIYCVRVGDKSYLLPPADEVGFYRRNASNVPRVVEEVNTTEMENMSSKGRLFSHVFHVLKTYQKLTGRVCMGMHHLDGYYGNPKRLVGILTNDGAGFIMAVNPEITGFSDATTDASYSSTLCPDRQVQLKGIHLSVSLKYVKYERFGADGKRHNWTYLPVRRDWFDGNTALCLQVVMMEFGGQNVCDTARKMPTTEYSIKRVPKGN